MKVDALLSASPKGEARKDVRFLKDKHRCSTAKAKDFLYSVSVEFLHFEKQMIHCTRPSCCFYDCKTEKITHCIYKLYKYLSNGSICYHIFFFFQWIILTWIGLKLNSKLSVQIGQTTQWKCESATYPNIPPPPPNWVAMAMSNLLSLFMLFTPTCDTEVILLQYRLQNLYFSFSH